MSLDLVLRRHDAAETLTLKDAVLYVYASSHEQPIRADPWFGADRFWQRLTELYAPGRDFEMVSAWVGEEAIGYAFGSPRDNSADTWRQVQAAISECVTPVDSEPIYIFREFAVHPRYQRKGVGRKVHDELLCVRPEPLAHLLVRQDNRTARTAYTSWGWRSIGPSQPFPDSPVMDAMVLPLPIHR